MPFEAHGVVDRDIGAGGNRKLDLMIDPESGRYLAYPVNAHDRYM